MPMKITKEIENKIILLSKTRSHSEIAKVIGCGKKTIWRVLHSNNVTRSAEDKTAIRSRVRTDLIRAERRRGIFGIDQKTDLKVFSNKERNVLKYCLRRIGYIFPIRGQNIAYYREDTKRNRDYEERGKKLGIIFMEADKSKVSI